MKLKYAFHPREFAIGENEKFYSDMAARGFALKKRGEYLSVFERTDPTAVKYRIEIVSQKELIDGALPQEQLAVYEDCGWEYVCGHGLMHIFRAPEESGAPEFYLEGAQQASTFKALKNKHLLALLSIPLYIIFYCVLSLLIGSGTLGAGAAAGRMAAQYLRAFVEETAFCLSLSLLLLWCVFQSVRALISIGALMRELKRGLSLDHAPKRKRSALSIISGLLFVLFAAAVVLTIVQRVGIRKHEMPLSPDGPYIVLADAGVPGYRAVDQFSGNGSSVKYSRSLLCEHWDTFEYIYPNIWLYQDVYTLRSGAFTDAFVRSLMADSVFAGSEEVFVKVDIQGLDSAYISGNLECIAVRGETVLYAEFIESGAHTLSDILSAVSAHWAALG